MAERRQQVVVEAHAGGNVGQAAPIEVERDLDLGLAGAAADRHPASGPLGHLDRSERRRHRVGLPGRLDQPVVTGCVPDGEPQEPGQRMAGAERPRHDPPAEQGGRDGRRADRRAEVDEQEVRDRGPDRPAELPESRDEPPALALDGGDVSSIGRADPAARP